MKKYIDLTHSIDMNMTIPPLYGRPRVKITQIEFHGLEGCENYKISLGSHTGTHIVAPAHLIAKREPRVDKIPLEITVGKCKMLRVPKDSYGVITVNDFENCGVEVKKGDRVIINTGWYKEWNTHKFYAEYPYLKKEAAQWLVDKGVTYVLMDMPFPDDPREKIVNGEPKPIQFIFFSQGVFLCKNLTSLDEITCSEFDLISLPVKLKDLDGAPIRIIAMIDQ